MPNKNYVKGRKKEYKIKKRYEERGYIVTRAAGSHSPFDLVCVHPQLKEIRLLQCKPENYTGADALMKKYMFLNASFQVYFEVV